MMNFSLLMCASFACRFVASQVSSAAGGVFSALVAVLRNPPRAYHLHVLVHQSARAGGIADFDEGRQFPVGVEDAARHARRERWVMRGPGDVLQRDELHHQDAVVGRLGDREMEFAPRARKAADVVDSALGIGDELAQPGMILGGGIDGGELSGAALDGVLRIHDLADRHAGEIELYRERLGEQAGIALGDTRTAAGADLDLDPALSFQRSQRVARDDAAHAETLGQNLFGAEEIARAKLFGEERVAHLNDDLRRHGRGAEGDDLPLAALHGRMKPHASPTAPAPCSPGEGSKRKKSSNDHKDDIFVPAHGSTPRAPHRTHFLRPAAWATPPQRLLSVSMWRANSSGPPLSGSMPCGRHVNTTSFAATASRTARASLSMISRGVPAGAMRPNQIEVSKSGMPASAMVGTFGKMPGRFDAADARARSEPASTWEITAEAGENIIVTRPARRSVAACGLP